jgi:predicted amidophosphoribosyltransferase
VVGRNVSTWFAGAWFAGAWAALVDLVLPARCAGCDAAGARGGLCGACHTAFAAANPARVRPEPAPPGLPRCLALAAYAGALRNALLAYKERDRRELTGVLGDRLAAVVAAALGGPRHAVLVPVPATVAAARRRQGDHMSRLARRAARRLRAAGWRVQVAYPLRALPRADSAGLSSAARAQVAGQSFTLRPERLPALLRPVRAGAVVVLVDDVVTTGATLCANAQRLRAAGVDVPVAAVLAATQRQAGNQGRARNLDGRSDKLPANEG